MPRFDKKRTLSGIQEGLERRQQEASVVQRQNYSLPSCRPGFDSRLMHFLHNVFLPSTKHDANFLLDLILNVCSCLRFNKDLSMKSLIFMYINIFAKQMNLKQRMQHQNRNNSSILNNSNFDFAKGNREDQVYEKSRRQCEEQLFKRKSQLEQEKYALIKTKEKEVSFAVEKFDSDFEEIRKQIVNQINQALTDMKARYSAEIRQRCMIEANEEVRVRTSIDEFLGIINSHLSGLKKDHYRQEIARIVVKDFDTPKEDIKNAIRRLRYPMPFTAIDEKFYNCLRSDLQKAIVVQFSNKKEGNQIKQQPVNRPISVPYSQGDINLHENRDRLKRSFQ